ncbi:hypothetical protein FQZ97_935030 [compost metagenome]
MAARCAWLMGCSTLVMFGWPMAPVPLFCRFACECSGAAKASWSAWSSTAAMFWAAERVGCRMNLSPVVGGGEPRGIWKPWSRPELSLMVKVPEGVLSLTTISWLSLRRRTL